MFMDSIHTQKMHTCVIYTFPLWLRILYFLCLVDFFSPLFHLLCCHFSLSLLSCTALSSPLFSLSFLKNILFSQLEAERRHEEKETAHGESWKVAA